MPETFRPDSLPPFNFGAPQCGHEAAWSDSCFPHSRQDTRAMMFPFNVYGSSVQRFNLESAVLDPLLGLILKATPAFCDALGSLFSECLLATLLHHFRREHS